MLNRYSESRSSTHAAGIIPERWGGPGHLSPGLPQNPYVTISRHTALVVLVI